MKITHDIRTTLWCGPAAISASTGEPTSKIMALAKHFTRDKVVKGISNRTLISTLDALGYRVEVVYESIHSFFSGGPPRPTLAAWTKANAGIFSEHPVIIMVTGHYVTVKGRLFVDTMTPGYAPVRLKKAPGRRSRVCRAWRITKK